MLWVSRCLMLGFCTSKLVLWGSSCPELCLGNIRGFFWGKAPGKLKSTSLSNLSILKALNVLLSVSSDRVEWCSAPFSLGSTWLFSQSIFSYLEILILLSDPSLILFRFITNPSCCRRNVVVPGFVNISSKLLPIFFLSGFVSRIRTTHRTAGKGRGPFFIPLYYFHPLTNIQTFICNFACKMTITYF